MAAAYARLARAGFRTGEIVKALKRFAGFSGSRLAFRYAFSSIRNPHQSKRPGLPELAATYNMMGKDKEGRAEVAEVLRINPNFFLDLWAKNLPYPQPQNEKVAAALRKAGLN